MGWAGGLVEWVEENNAYLSVVFSWQLDKAYGRAAWLTQQGYKVRAGGPAIAFNPDYLAGVAKIGGEVNALPHHNPDATLTTRGCIRHCPFCIVPKVEGALRELPDDEWEPKSMICDNNLLAASRSHFDNVINRLLASDVRGIDFNGGFDARLLTPHHALRIFELYLAEKLRVVRLAWDEVKTEAEFRRAINILSNSGLPIRLVTVYALIGYQDTPEDALYRAETIRGLGAWPYPLRYQPLDSKRRNDFVGEHWTHQELMRFTHYWQRSKYLSSIPFEEYIHPYPRKGRVVIQSEAQMQFSLGA